MTDTNIIRNPSTEERRDFNPIANAGRKKKPTAEEKFYEDLGNVREKANKKGQPFAETPCKNDFYDHYNQEVKKSIRKNGYVEPEDIRPVNINWNKYSDLNNFEVVEEGETYDEELTKKNPGLHVTSKWTKYKFKGYSNVYVVMEDGPSAVKRAQEKAKKPLEKTETKTKPKDTREKSKNESE